MSCETHHELLVYEGLLALTNIASTQQAQNDNLGLSTSLFKMQMGKRRGKDHDESNENRTLYYVITQELVFEKNPRIQLAACELLANLSLTSDFQELVSSNDDEQEGSESLINSQLNRDLKLLLALLVNSLDSTDPQVNRLAYMRAILGLFANLISFESVRFLLKKHDNGKFLD